MTINNKIIKQFCLDFLKSQIFLLNFTITKHINKLQFINKITKINQYKNNKLILKINKKIF